MCGLPNASFVSDCRSRAVQTWYRVLATARKFQEGFASSFSFGVHNALRHSCWSQRMSLFSCPNEVLEQVIWQVSSDDIENFTSTCRLLRKLSQPCLKEHFKLKSWYGYNINYPSSKRCLHPAHILSAIIENPKTAYYIKALSLTFSSGRSISSGRVEDLIAKHDGFRNQLNGNMRPC